jgi:GT2 family glycosyltransferase/peptidoglycan/xylan/chitin deacetylase (PgdA/CDA1 family)
LDVSIIIVNWNTRHLLEDCLSSVYKYPSRLEFEVVVIDNASEDDSTQMVRREFPDVKLIVNNTNKGYAAACNQGIRSGNSRYVLLLNSDVVVCEGAIDSIVRYADSRPDTAVVGCQVWQDSQTIQLTCFRYPSLANLLLRTFGLSRAFEKNRILGREWMRWWHRDSEKQVDVVSGMFMLVRRTAIDQVGLMDEDYFFYGEEMDWCYRFSKAGWKIMFWPGAKAIHVNGGGQSSKKTPINMFVQEQKSKLIFFKKHRSFPSYLSARLILLVLLVLRYCVWTVIPAVKLRFGRDSTYKLNRQKTWCAIKFCAFGIEPQNNETKSAGSVSKCLVGTVEFIFALIHAAVLAVFHTVPRRIVIYYHSLKKKDVGKFDKQMEYVAKHCSVVKASQIMTAHSNGADLVVGITFDDAFVSIFENALPVLTKYRLLASIFVPTANLGRHPNWVLEEKSPDAEEIIMNEEQIKQIDRAGHEILSHTVSHPHLTKLDDVRLKVELDESKQTLERIVGHNVPAISYPYGDCDTRTCDAAQRAGYQVGFSVEPCKVDVSANKFQIGRFSVAPTDSMLKFRLKVGGAYQVVKYLRKLKKIFVRT